MALKVLWYIEMSCSLHELLSERVSMQELDRREVRPAKINAKINVAVFYKLTPLSVFFSLEEPKINAIWLILVMV